MSEVIEFGNDGGNDDTPPPTPPPRKQREPRESREPRENARDPAVAMANSDSMSIVEWLQTEFSGQQRVRIKVIRSWPKTYNEQFVGGLLDVFDEFISEEMIKERFGGGKFVIQVLRMTAKGGWTYGGQRSIEVAGQPKPVDAPPAVTLAPVHEDSGLASRAMAMMERTANEDRNRAVKVEQELREKMNQSGIDTQLIDLIVAPLREQLRAQQDASTALQTELRRRDEKMTEILTRPPTVDPTQNKLLERFIDGDNTRLDAVRAAHETELRTMRENHHEDIKRTEDRFSRMVETNEKAHEREVRSVETSHSSELKTREIAFNSQVDSLKSQISMLERDLDATKKELGELRGKKDVPIEDQLSKLVTVKEMMDSFTGKSDESDQPVWKQVADVVMNSPMAQGLAQRISGPPPGQQPQMRMVPRRLVRQVPHAVPLPPGASPTPTPPTQALPPAPPPPKVVLDPATVLEAIKFIEVSVQNDVDPTNFAQTIRSMVPSSIIDSLRIDGIDGILQYIPSNSPLQSQSGLNFLRKVAKILANQK